MRTFFLNIFPNVATKQKRNVKKRKLQPPAGPETEVFFKPLRWPECTQKVQNLYLFIAIARPLNF